MHAIEYVVGDANKYNAQNDLIEKAKFVEEMNSDNIGSAINPKNIDWIDKTFNSYDEAYEYLEKFNSGNYQMHAVKYKDEGKVYWLLKFEYHC